MRRLVAAALALGAAGAAATEVTDQRGHTHHLEQPAERVVTLPMPAPSAWIGLDGGAPRLVGMNPVSLEAIRGHILGRIFPDSLRVSTEVVRGGIAPNVEAILALRPDAVFQWSTSGPDAILALERAGLRTFGMAYGTQERLRGYTRMMAAVAGKPARAEAILAWHGREQAMLEAALAAVSEGRRPRVLHLGRAAQAFAPAGTGTYNDWAIRLAGGRNAAASHPGNRGEIGVEQLLAWAPEVILLGNFDAAVPADVYANPLLRSLPAVRERRVYKVPLGGYRWDPPSLESPLAWLWLARLLHPEAELPALRPRMVEAFALLYGHALSDGEAAEILATRANAASRHAAVR